MDPKSKLYIDTQFFVAVRNAQIHIARMFLEKGADINYKNEHGQTALMYAAECGESVVCRFLMESGVLSLQHITLNLVEKEGISHGGLPEILFRR